MSPDNLHQYLLNGANPLPFDIYTKRRVRKRDGERCVICGIDKDLTVAHRIHRNGSDDPRFNDLYNLILMCEKDHRRFDGDTAPQIAIPYWDPLDKEGGLEVAMETKDGEWVAIDKAKLAFYQL